jgi:hypothetical protein
VPYNEPTGKMLSVQSVTALEPEISVCQQTIEQFAVNNLHLVHTTQNISSIDKVHITHYKVN